MVIGSSGLPAPVISCMSALPMEVTRSETCVSLPSMSACCGTDVPQLVQLGSDYVAHKCESPGSSINMYKDIFLPELVDRKTVNPFNRSCIRRTQREHT